MKLPAPPPPNARKPSGLSKPGPQLENPAEVSKQNLAEPDAAKGWTRAAWINFAP